MSVLNIDKIGYIAETDHDYVRELDKATSLKLLGNLLADWEPLVWDARADFSKYITNEAEFEKWRKFLTEERKGKAHSKQAYVMYASITLPAPLMVVTEVAMKFKVPWGTAFIRMREEGVLKIDKKGRVIPQMLPPEYLKEYGVDGSEK